jgi:hypothetical protein
MCAVTADFEISMLCGHRRRSGGWIAWLVTKTVGAIEAFGDYAVQWPAGISFAQVCWATEPAVGMAYSW